MWESEYLSERFWSALAELGAVINPSAIQPNTGLDDIACLIAHRIHIARMAYRVSRERAAVYFCFLDSEEINAWATRLEDDVYCIIIPVTLWNRLVHLNANLLRSSQLVNYLGLEGSWRQRARPERPFLDSSAMVANTALSEGELHQSAAGLSVASFNFLLFHEIGHIFDGHLASGLTLSAYISESRAIVGDNTKLLTEQALEFDADMFGMSTAMQCALREEQPEYCTTFLRTPEQTCRFAIVGAYSAMKIFDAVFAYNPEWATSSTHPAAWFRMKYIAAAATVVAATALRRNPAELKDDLATNGPANVEIAFINMTNDTSVFDRLGDHPFEPILERFLEIRPALMAVKLIFQPLNFGGNDPFAG